MIFVWWIRRLHGRYQRMDNFRRLGNYVPALFLLFLLAFSSCRQKPDKADIVAQVGSRYLTRQALEARLQRDGLEVQLGSQFVERWVNREVLFQEAQRLGLDNTDELALELETVEKEFLINKLLERTFQEKIIIEEPIMRSYYEKHEALFKMHESQVHMFHILTETREVANTARQALLAGQAFDEVAQTYSTGIFKSSNGDMGFVKENDIIPELRRSAFRIALNQISPVIRSDHGYHLLKVTGKLKKDDIRPFEDVKSEVYARLRASKERQIYYDLVYHLQNQTHVYVAIPTAADSLRATH